MYIFVYGTLKRGFYNHDLLENAEFVCEAITKEKYPMVNTEGYFPYLINNKGLGHYIQGEVYKIDEIILATLDILESYPSHYDRRQIQVVSLGIELTAIVYFLKDEIDYQNLQLLESF